MEQMAADIRTRVNGLTQELEALEGSGAKNEIDEEEALAERIDTLKHRAQDLDLQAEEHRAARQGPSVFGAQPGGRP